ncbi:MAG: hypothetical protein ACLQDF_06455 [Desulfomonilia bacterium]
MMHLIPRDDPKQALRIMRFLMAFGTYIIWMLIALYCYDDGLFARALSHSVNIGLKGISPCNFAPA